MVNTQQTMIYMIKNWRRRKKKSGENDREADKSTEKGNK